MDKLFNIPQTPRAKHDDVWDDAGTPLIIGSRVTDTVCEGTVTDLDDGDGWVSVYVTFADDTTDIYRTRWTGFRQICDDVQVIA